MLSPDDDPLPDCIDEVGLDLVPPEVERRTRAYVALNCLAKGLNPDRVLATYGFTAAELEPYRAGWQHRRDLPRLPRRPRPARAVSADALPSEYTSEMAHRKEVIAALDALSIGPSLARVLAAYQLTVAELETYLAEWEYLRGKPSRLRQHLPPPGGAESLAG